MRVHVFDDPETLAETAAGRIAEWIRGADPLVSLGLAGGSTPGATYERLRSADIAWDQVNAWLSDERWVPPGHPESNARMAREKLFDHVSARFHGVPWELGDPQEAATEYERRLAELSVTSDPGLVLLGVGADGHTASLFPATAALAERRRSFVANWVPQHQAWRLTATLPLLWSARRLVFLATGRGKAAAIRDILEGDATNPAATAARGAGEAAWFLDGEAASLLERTVTDG
ncbi:MAG: 6-phosphogluconolactonase [Acidimicrobiia bacterium]